MDAFRELILRSALPPDKVMPHVPLSVRTAADAANTVTSRVPCNGLKPLFELSAITTASQRALCWMLILLLSSRYRTLWDSLRALLDAGIGAPEAWDHVFSRLPSAKVCTAADLFQYIQSSRLTVEIKYGIWDDFGAGRVLSTGAGVGNMQMLRLRAVPHSSITAQVELLPSTTHAQFGCAFGASLLNRYYYFRIDHHIGGRSDASVYENDGSKWNTDQTHSLGSTTQSSNKRTFEVRFSSVPPTVYTSKGVSSSSVYAHFVVDNIEIGSVLYPAAPQEFALVFQPKALGITTTHQHTRPLSR